MSQAAAVGIVLAAGASRRAGCVKALATLAGETFVARTVRVLEEGGCDPVLVVVGPPHEQAVRAATPHARHVRNPAPARGMLSSLQTALHCVDTGPVVVALVDHPRVSSSTVAALLSEWRRSGGAPAIRPRYAERCGHPYLLSGPLLDEIRSLEPRSVLRSVLRTTPRVLSLDVDDRHVLDDLDTQSQLEAATGRAPSWTA